MILVAFVYASCKKNPIEDPHNHSLLDKTIDQIRNEIAGKWQNKTHTIPKGVALLAVGIGTLHTPITTAIMFTFCLMIQLNKLHIQVSRLNLRKGPK
jgi:hypothetical protein